MDAVRPVWEGKIDDVYLRVAVLPSGRIEAQWRTKSGNERRVVVNSAQELERSVLFQLMITAGPDARGIPGDIAQAVAQARVGLPEPGDAPRVPKKKRRRPGGPPRRNRPRR